MRVRNTKYMFYTIA